MEAKQHVTQQYVTKEIKQGTKNYLQRNENKSMTIQNQWKEAKAIQRGKLQQYNLTSGNKYLKQSNLTPKATRGRTNKTQYSRRKEIIKSRAETDTKQTAKLKAGSLKRLNRKIFSQMHPVKNRERAQIKIRMKKEVYNGYPRNTKGYKRLL